jgi:hypothetical protein
MEFKEIKAISEELTFELEVNPVLNPPTLKVKIAPINPALVLPFARTKESGDAISISDGAALTLLDAIQEWNLPFPCSQAIKYQYLTSFKILFGTMVAGQKRSLFFALFEYAADIGNYLKN